MAATTRRRQRWSTAWKQSAADDRLAHLLQRRRGLRSGMIQVVYLVVGCVSGVLAPLVEAGPSVQASTVEPLLYGMAGGLISFIALVFSLLFLVVQFSTTTVSPRLTIFRDDPLVWHCFGFFSAVLVYCATTGMRVGTHHDEVTVFAPAMAMVLVLLALGLSRQLQMRALKLLQFNTTMDEIRARGEAVLTRFYTAPHDEPRRAPGDVPRVVREIRWPGPLAYLQQVDLPALLAEAQELDGVIELRARIGEELRRGAVVVALRCAHDVDVDDDDVLACLATGVDRMFTQDPLLAFRLLNDIGNRALSTAINDPETAVHVVACVEDLLVQVADRHLDFGPIEGPDGRPRVQILFPTWEEFVTAALDEVLFHGRGVPTVATRLTLLFDDLIPIVPPGRRPILEARRATLADTVDIVSARLPASLGLEVPRR